MKKSVKIWIAAAVCVVVVGVVLLVYMNSFGNINARQVEKIVFYTDSNRSTGIVLDADETKEFIKLFNTSKYGGLTNGEGGTPDLGVAVHFRNGAILYVNEFGGHHNFEAHRAHAIIKGKGYYLDSGELCDFMLALEEKYS